MIPTDTNTNFSKSSIPYFKTSIARIKIIFTPDREDGYSFKNSVVGGNVPKEYVTMYADLKRKEIESFRSEISDIEYKWYLNL